MPFRALLLSVLFAVPAFAEAGLPFYELCSSPPCACGANSCACGEICTGGQCRPAQQGYCSTDSQCGTGSCGAFVCEMNVCVVSDGGVRSDAGVAPVDGGSGTQQPGGGGCSVGPGVLLLGAALMLRRSFSSLTARAR